MKTNPFKLMAAVVMGAVLLTAFQCGKEEPVEVNHNARHSKCLSHTDKEAKGFYSPDSASVVYDAARQHLHVTHHNLAVNCGTAAMEGGIIVTAIRNGQTIDIYDARFQGLDEAIKLTGGNYAHREEGNWYWTADRDADPNYAGYAWYSSGGGGYLGNYILCGSNLAVPVALLK